MQVTQTIADGLKHEFMIVVLADEIESKVEDRLKELSTPVRLPGFRPGKASMSLVRKRYTQSVMGEVLELSIQDGVRKTLEDHKLTPAMQPKIEIVSFESGKPLEFKMAFDALPEIADMDIAAIEVPRPKVAIPEAEVDESLKRIAESRKTTEEVSSSRQAKMGDVLTIDFAGRIDGAEFAGGKAEGADLELGSGTFIPGFEDQLVGAQVDDVVTVNVTFPEDYHAKDLAGKDAEFVVTVKALKEFRIPELDEDFAKSVGLEDVEALRKAVVEQLEKHYEQLARARMKRDLLDKLFDLAVFPVPESLVEAEFNGIWGQIEHAKEHGHLDEDDKGKSDEELREEYRRIADRRIRLGLLLADIGRKNKVDLSQEDINRAVLQEARQYPGQERSVFEYFQKTPEAVNQLRGALFEDKVVDFLLELAKTPEMAMTVEELTGSASPSGSAPKKKATRKSARKKAEDGMQG